MESMESSPIVDFFREQSVFITGATGFLGKVLIEKLLRSCSEVDKIYVLIRSKRGRSVKERLQDVFEQKLFDRIREEKPQQFYKVIALEGDLDKPEFGLSENDKAILYDKVSIVFHSAATVKLDEPLRVAVNTNVLATSYVIDACKKMRHLKAFVHVSTAYSNFPRTEIDEKVYDVPFDIHSLLETVENSDDETLATLVPSLLKGRLNTYTLTKAIAENLVEREFPNLPVAIVRPAIVVATLKEPFPGWIDNLNGPTGFIIAVSKGILQSIFLNPEAAIEFIPVDLVINLLLSVAWRTATHRTDTLMVYNCCSSWANKMSQRELLEWTVEHSIKYPSSKMYFYPNCGIPSRQFIHTLKAIFYHYLPAYIMDIVALCSGKKSRNVIQVNRLHQALKAVQPVNLKDLTFHCNNVAALLEDMKGQDKQTFNFDVHNVNWKNFLFDYMFGIREYFLKEDPSSIPEARIELQRVYLKTQAFKVFTTLVACGVLWNFSEQATSLF